MGLLRAAAGAVGGVLADQWRECFVCTGLDGNTLAVKGEKKNSRRSSNVRGEDNIISNGSGIIVADGQCMMIVEQGKIVELCAEPGEFIYDASTEPSVFTGKFGKSLLDTFKIAARRFTFGGDTGKDQRVYYFNTKEIMDNKFGTANPLMFRVTEPRAFLDIEVDIRCNGIYSYRIADPVVFYTHISGNFSEVFTRDMIDMQLKTEFVDALQPALASLSNLELRPYQIPQHVRELKDSMNRELSDSWGRLRGLSIVKIAMNPITLTPESAERIRHFQEKAADRQALRDPGTAAAELVSAQSEAMRKAAANEGSGAVGAFMGVGMAGQAGGARADVLYGIAAKGNPEDGAWKCECGSVNDGKFCRNCGKPKPADSLEWKCECGTMNDGKFCRNCGKPKPADPSEWMCECGATNRGKYCVNCGKKKPEKSSGWKCECGTVNHGNYCINCGKKKQEPPSSFRCDKCGWVPEDPSHPPKFCPRCGDRFDEADKTN